MKNQNIKSNLIAVVLLIIIGVATYANSFRNEFIYDDNSLVVKNIFIRSPKYIKDIFKTSLHYFQDPGKEERGHFYRPVVALSFMLDYFLWGLDSLGYHLTNTVFHVFNAVLIYLLIGAISKNKKIAFFTSLLFVVHPIHTEAVTYVSGRADMIAVFFLLLSFLAYIKGSNIGNGWNKYYLSSLLLFSIALLAKELAMILIFLLLLYDCSFIGESRSLRITTKNKYVYLPYLAIIVVYLLIRQNILHITPQAVRHTLYIRLITTSKVIVDYFRLLIFPTGLHMERVVPISGSIFEPRTLFSVILLVLLGILIARSYRRSKIVFFGSLWFFIALFPFLNIIPLNAYMAEHWLYLPSVGFFLVIAVGVDKTLNLKKPILKNYLFKSFIVGIFILVLIFYSFLTIKQNRIWKNPATFFNYTSKYSSTIRIHANLGNLYLRNGQTEKAIQEYNKVLAINPDEYQIYTNLGNVYFKTNQLDKAMEMYNKALAIYPKNPHVHNNLGVLYKRMGKPEAAIVQFKKAIDIYPNHIDAHSNLAKSYFDKKMYKESRAEWERVLEINPYHEGAIQEIKRLK